MEKLLLRTAGKTDEFSINLNYSENAKYRNNVKHVAAETVVGNTLEFKISNIFRLSSPECKFQTSNEF